MSSGKWLWVWENLPRKHMNCGLVPSSQFPWAWQPAYNPSSREAEIGNVLGNTAR